MDAVMVITPTQLFNKLSPIIAKRYSSRIKLLQKIDKTIKRQLAKFDGVNVVVYFLRSRFEWDENISYMLELYEKNGWVTFRHPHKKDPSQKRIFGFVFRPEVRLTQQLLGLSIDDEYSQRNS